MTTTLALARPLPTQTAAQNAVITPVLTDRTGAFVVDLKAPTDDSTPRLLGRLRVTPTKVGATIMQLKIELLKVPDAVAAEDATDTTTATFADAELSTAAELHTTSGANLIDIDAIFVAASDVAGS